MKPSILTLTPTLTFTFTLLFFCLKTEAQQYGCLTDSIYKSKQAAVFHPELLQPPSENGIITIPVVIHVIHHNGPENISDAQVMSQMVVLNNDFRRLNADTVNTDSIFKPVAADMKIEFCLATKDPSGNSTNGIIHTFDTSTANAFDLIRKYGWNNKKYLNIYVTYFTGAFSSFPWSPDSADGIFVPHYRFGTIGTAGSDPLDSWSKFGRTCTHEVGHYIGLMHTFCFCGSEDEIEVSCDTVYDTPPCNIRLAVGECMPHGQYSCFLDLSKPDQVDNYMDYNIDSCSNMFSLGQKTRAAFYLQRYRAELTSDSNLASTGCFNASGINEAGSATKISISPNPNHGIFTITLSETVPANSELVILNALGEKVYSAEISSNKNHPLLIKNLLPGVYLILLETDNHSISTKMMIE